MIYIYQLMKLPLMTPLDTLKLKDVMHTLWEMSVAIARDWSFVQFNIRADQPLKLASREA